jgi:hypothetical protein
MHLEILFSFLTIIYMKNVCIFKVYYTRLQNHILEGTTDPYFYVAAAEKSNLIYPIRYT